MDLHEDLVAHRDELLGGAVATIDDVPFIGARYGSSTVVHLRTCATYHHWLFATPHRTGGALNAAGADWRPAALCEETPRWDLGPLPALAARTGPFAHLGDPEACASRRTLCVRCARAASSLLWRRGSCDRPHWWSCRGCYDEYVAISLTETAGQLRELLGDLSKVRATKLDRPTRERVQSLLGDLARESVDPWLLVDVIDMQPRTLNSLTRGMHPAWCPAQERSAECA